MGMAAPMAGPLAGVEIQHHHILISQLSHSLKKLIHNPLENAGPGRGTGAETQTKVVAAMVVGKKCHNRPLQCPHLLRRRLAMGTCS